MATPYLHTLRLFSRDVRLYLITTVLLGFTIFGGIYSVLLNLYLLRLGYGPEFVGLFNAVGLLTFAVFSLPAGALGGRWGSRRTLIAGLGLTSVGLGVLPLAEFIPSTLQAA
ncbi:MAG: MFS transporter [Candidatus Bipolaricaulia bacterium]